LAQARAKPQAANTESTTMKGAFWFLGILVLAATFIGVKFFFEQSASAQAKQKSEIEAAKPQDKVIAWGNFDIERGVAGLYPKQFGDIIFLAPEHTQVKAGEVLLKIEDKLAKLKVEEAKADVEASKQQVAEAKLLAPLYDLQAEQQSAAVRAIQLEIDKLALERKTKELADLSPSQKKTFQDYYESGAKMLGEKKNAEEAKLKQIKLQDAKLKIAQAEADLHAKELRQQEAQELLTHFQVVAPSDGRVLRVYVRKGETLGPNPRIHAIDFLPDAPIIVRAEVLQEWGHLVKVGQEVSIEDDTYRGPEWKGKIKSISGWYAPTRSPIIEPFKYNDVRTLECIITVESGDATKFIGQRVRAKIKL
jgi:biotin carboxyl carrier protein